MRKSSRTAPAKGSFSSFTCRCGHSLYQHQSSDQSRVTMDQPSSTARSACLLTTTGELPIDCASYDLVFTLCPCERFQPTDGRLESKSLAACQDAADVARMKL